MTSARTALFLALVVSLALVTVATFEVLERVQAEPSDESVVAQQEGIRVVAEIRGSPNLGDSDGDGVPDDIDNCPAWANAGQTLPPWPIPPGDPDCDGFTTTIENFVGTLPLDNCPATGFVTGEGAAGVDDEDPDPWPSDFNDDQFTTVSDFVRFIPVFNSPTLNPYDPRFDLTMDGFVTVVDMVMMIPMFNKSCTP